MDKCKRCGGTLILDGGEFAKFYHEDVYRCFSCSRRYNNKGELVSPPRELEPKSDKVRSIFKNI